MLGKPNSRNTSRKSLSNCLDPQLLYSTQSAISVQQGKLVVDQVLEMNDSVNRHQYLWICHYRKYRCEYKVLEQIGQTDEMKNLATRFRDCAKLRFKGIKYYLIADDLCNAQDILVNTDDQLQQGTNMTLVEMSKAMIEMEAHASSRALREVFKHDIFRKFYVAINEKVESPLMEDNIMMNLKPKVFRFLQVIQYLDHQVSMLIDT
jgi:hypothetical protein